jgi:hypothetical protein
MVKAATTKAGPRLPLWYRLFFLYIEPFSTVIGFYYAFMQQRIYLNLTHLLSAPQSEIPLGTSIVLSQLANLYLLFALNEALVLRSTTDLNVWRALIVGLLIADFGHLFSVAPLGLQIYWDFFSWNPIDWGNIGFVYLGAATRIAFLMGFGFPKTRGRRKASS